MPFDTDLDDDLEGGFTAPAGVDLSPITLQLTPEQAMDFDARAAVARLGLGEALSSQRSNGLSAMIARLRSDAQTSL